MNVIDLASERQARRNAIEAELICLSALDQINRRRDEAIAAYNSNPQAWLAAHGVTFAQFLSHCAAEESEWTERMP